MSTLILGIGNTTRGDDGVGVHIARECRNAIDRKLATIVETTSAGLELLSLVSGYDRLIVVDAICTVDGKPGDIHHLTPEPPGREWHMPLLHDVSLPAVLQMGNALGLPVPQDVVILAVEVARMDGFSGECSPEVRQAIPACVSMIHEKLSQGKGSGPRGFGWTTHPGNSIGWF